MRSRHGRESLGLLGAWREVLPRKPFAVLVGVSLSMLLMAVIAGPIGANRVDEQRTGTVMGLAAPNAPADQSALVGFETYGRNADYLLWYNDFTTRLDVDALRALPPSVTPIVTWEPFDAVRGGVEQPRYRLASIANGAYDAYLRRWAEDLRSVQRRVILRFAHEMNGDWYPWSEQVNSNGSGEYVRAWSHVQDVLRDAGVTTVQWMWSPNVEYPGSQSLDGLYPGDDRVDLIGIDGYNWGTSRGDQAWQWPRDVFASTVERVRGLTARPILISEVGSTELGGNKAEWIDRFADFLAETPQVEGFVWFDYDKETDWRIDSSVESSGAFVDLVARLPSRADGQPRRAPHRAAIGSPGPVDSTIGDDLG